MLKLLILFILTTLLSCKEDLDKKNEVKNQDVVNKSIDDSHSSIYKFDSTSSTNGCANVLLQKISNDLRYELMIELVFDSLPKFEEIDIKKYSKFVKIYLNKFNKNNKYIDQICNDSPMVPKNWEKPTIYTLISGNLKITDWTEKDEVISVSTKDLILQDSTKEIIRLPIEYFKQLKVHWIGG